jgi:YVTN family beta-propeller protein
MRRQGLLVHLSRRRMAAVLVASLTMAAYCLGVSSAGAEGVIRTIPLGTNSFPLGVSSDGTHVWVANFGEGTVSEIEASSGTVIRTIPIDVGSRPWGVSSDGTDVWVTNNGEDTVSEIEASSGTVIREIDVGRFPLGVSSDGTHVWVANSGEGTVSEIEASSGTVIREIHLGSLSRPFGVSSDGSHVWVTSYGEGLNSENLVSEIKASTGTVIPIFVPFGTGSSGVSSDGTDVWVANHVSGTVSEIEVPRYAAHVVGGEYVALGDSFSSGEGTRQYEGPPDEPTGTACHRSPQSWPSLVSTELKSSDLKLKACSGAELHDLYEEGAYERSVPTLLGSKVIQWNEPPQLDGIAPEDSTAPGIKLVTLSVGGNNAGFAGIVERCVAKTPTLFWKTLEKECKVYGTKRVKEGRNALKSGENNDGKSLTYILAQIHMRAPNAWIRVMLYPTLFSPFKPTPAEPHCNIGATVNGRPLYVELSSQEVKDIDGWESDVNNEISKIVNKWAKPLLKREPRSVEVVSAQNAFAGGNLCTTDHEFINQVTIFGGLAAESEPESLHPTAMGYEQLSAAVLETLEE